MSSDFYNTSILPYAGIIIKICRAYTHNQADFEDYYQEVCLHIWRSREKFRAESEWSTWVYRISLNVCLTLFRKEQSIEKRELNASSEIVVGNLAFKDEQLNQLYNAIRQLKQVERAIILLYLEEKPYEEIAQIIGTSSNNIAVRINRIKTKLKELLHG